METKRVATSRVDHGTQYIAEQQIPPKRPQQKSDSKKIARAYDPFSSYSIVLLSYANLGGSSDIIILLGLFT